MIPTPPPNVALDIGQTFVVAAPMAYLVVTIDADGFPDVQLIPTAFAIVSPERLMPPRPPTRMERGG